MSNNKKNPFIAPSVESDTIETLSYKLIQVTDELKRANDALSDKNRALQESERLRKAMIANISHDLRAPLTAIRSALELLANPETRTCDMIEDSLRLIDRRIHNLEGLVQDLYFLTTVTDTMRDLNLEPIKLGPFLENYFFDATVDSRYDDHDMQLDVPIDLDATVMIDIQKTIRVLDNLFTNAAKYSGSGSQITLRAYTEDNHAIIIVSDNGIGIPSESIPHIFKPTYTVSSARTPGVETGSGLGLAIVKSVIEKENGTIRCESEQKKGSSFIIELPLR